MPVDWKITLPLEKSDRTDGWYIRGIASGTEVDQEGDALTEKCVSLFAHQINANPVPLNDWHTKNSILSEMGAVEKAWLEDGSRLGVEIKLDEDHPSAQYMWKRINKGRQYGLSVEGDIVSYSYDSTRQNSKGGPVRVIDEANLSAIAATTKPIYTPSFGTVLRKALDEAEASKIAKGDTAPMGDTPTADPVIETTTPTEGAVAPTSAPTVETPVAKAVSADTKTDAKKLDKLVQHVRSTNALLEELGLGDLSAPAVSAEPVEAAKSTDEAKSDLDVVAIVKSAVEETTAKFMAEIEGLKARIPEVQAPALLVKSEAEEAREALDEIRKSDPQTAIRLALAARHGETYTGR